jgi:signal transduction histidine kinase
MHMEHTYGLPVTMDAYKEGHFINEDRRILTFQIVRELLFNVVKHAEANEARVALSRQDGACVIQVEDDGVGFDPSILQDQRGGQSGFGLSSLRERLDLIGGDLRAIDSEPGAGTRIAISIPTEAARAES